MGREWRPDHDRASEALQPGKPAATDRHGLPSLTHSFTLDFVVLTTDTIHGVRQAKAEIKQRLESELHLTLSEEKTKLTHLNTGLDFLGFHLQRVKPEGRWVVHLRPSEKTGKRVKATIKACTTNRQSHLAEVTRLRTLNHIVLGWCEDYQYTTLASDL